MAQPLCIIDTVCSIQRFMKWMLLFPGDIIVTKGEKDIILSVLLLYITAAKSQCELRGAVLCLIQEYLAAPTDQFATAAQKESVSRWYQEFTADSTVTVSSSDQQDESRQYVTGQDTFEVSVVRLIVVEIRPNHHMSLLYPSTSGGLIGDADQGKAPGGQSSIITDFEMSNECEEVKMIAKRVRLALAELGYAAIDVVFSNQTVSELEDKFKADMEKSRAIKKSESEMKTVAVSAVSVDPTQLQRDRVVRVVDYHGSVLWAAAAAAVAVVV